ncbi:(R)-mandelonitrile lyase 1-like [Cucumis melo var. makuwa]|uniref:(R)-mandelonitrile lyase 1-like n=1 Tax=Cucumis melo var. makuwa TaxID=1194695 RepID=A0A5A7T475_CUCMM|nr:(R)-mandelonitrile lyase 1-like [Cucumis melo var. makuwa]
MGPFVQDLDSILKGTTYLLTLKVVDDVEDQQLSVPEIVVHHRVTDHVENDTLCRVDVDLIVVKRPIVRHVINDFIWKRQHFRNLELERYVTQNGKIPISIALGQDMPISPHAVCFNNTINMLTRDTFPICFLKWADVTPEYIELVKDSLQEQSSMNRAARARQPYNHSSNVKSFLHNHNTSLLNNEVIRSTVSSSTSVERELTHIMEVNELLKNRLEVVEEESNRKHEESIRLIKAQTRQMKEMRQMIEDLS